MIVEASTLVTVTPASRKDGLPFRPATRFSEKTTSSAVTGLPSENVAPWRSLRVSVLPSGETVYDWARAGTGLDTSDPLKVSNVS